MYTGSVVCLVSPRRRSVPPSTQKQFYVSTSLDIETIIGCVCVVSHLFLAAVYTCQFMWTDQPDHIGGRSYRRVAGVQTLFSCHHNNRARKTNEHIQILAVVSRLKLDPAIVSLSLFNLRKPSSCLARPRILHNAPTCCCPTENRRIQGSLKNIFFFNQEDA